MNANIVISLLVANFELSREMCDFSAFRLSACYEFVTGAVHATFGIVFLCTIAYLSREFYQRQSSISNEIIRLFIRL
jgi:hypothetical protein